MTAPSAPDVDSVASLNDVRSARSLIARIHIDDKVRDYIIELVRATRDPAAYGLAELGPFVEYGGSPRASIFLAIAARAHSFLRHRGFVTPEDVKAVGRDVLRHRIVLTYEAEADDVATDDIIARLFERMASPRLLRSIGIQPSFSA